MIGSSQISKEDNSEICEINFTVQTSFAFCPLHYFYTDNLTKLRDVRAVQLNFL